MLGPKLDHVPLGPVFDGTNVYGVTIDYPSQAAKLVRYDVAGDAVTPVVASPWVGQYSAVSPTALVK